jgi:hypothetical protein
LAGLLFLLVVAPASARIVQPWPAAKLTEQADLIVIARPTATGDAAKSDKPPKGYDDLVGTDTEFKVLAVLKGKLEGEKLALFHFRHPLSKTSSQSPEVDGPGLVAFDPKAQDGRSRYLLFLKKRKDGRYECVSGQVDPDSSVAALAGPSDDR